MRFYQQQHRFYCGVDLHARSMYLCILDWAKRWQTRMNAKHPPGKTLGILAAKLGRTVYHLWRTKQVFDEARFFAN